MTILFCQRYLANLAAPKTGLLARQAKPGLERRQSSRTFFPLPLPPMQKLSQLAAFRNFGSREKKKCSNCIFNQMKNRCRMGESCSRLPAINNLFFPLDAKNKMIFNFPRRVFLISNVTKFGKNNACNCSFSSHQSLASSSSLEISTFFCSYLPFFRP